MSFRAVRLSFFAPAAVKAGDGHNGRPNTTCGSFRGSLPFLSARRRCGCGRADFNQQYCFAALDLRAILEKRLGNSLAVYKRAIGRTKVTQETARRLNFQQAMVAREKAIIRQAQLRGITATDEKSIVLVKGEGAPGVRAR